MGMLMSDRGMEAHRTVGLPFTPAMLPTLAADAEALRADLGKKAEEYYGADNPVSYAFSFDIRYVGQGRTLTVETDDVSEQDLSELAQAFAREHQRRYRYADPDGDIEVVNIHCHLRSRGPRDDVEVASVAAIGVASAESHGTRAVHLRNGTHVTVPLYKRSGLPVESTVTGPAIIEQYDSVIILQPGDMAEIKNDMSMVISIDALENPEVERDES
jgi:N-methylhydantoinase A